MTTSPAPWDGPLPFVPNELGTLKAALRGLPAEVAGLAWERGVQFAQWTIRPRSQPMDYYDPLGNSGAGELICRPATWTCLQTPETRAVRRFFPVLLRAVDGCDPDPSQMVQARQGVQSILGLDWSPLARHVWDGNAGFATEQTDPTDANTLANAALTTNVATVDTVAAHGLTSGDQVVIAGSTDSTFNGTYTVTVTDADSFTFPRVHANISSAASVGTVFKVGGQWRSPNPALTDAATVAGTHNPIAAVARLTKAIREADYRGQIWFHAPEWLVYAYGNAGMLTQSGSTLLLPGGHVLIADPAYPGTGADGPVVSADAETWIYATPPLFGDVRAVRSANVVNYDPNAVSALGCSFVQWAIAQTVGIAMWDQEFAFGTKTYWDATHGSAT